MIVKFRLLCNTPSEYLDIYRELVKVPPFSVWRLSDHSMLAPVEGFSLCVTQEWYLANKHLPGELYSFTNKCSKRPFITDKPNKLAWTI